MTNTQCPHCNVLLDLPKYATGACDWCGERLPADLVAHARERVAQRQSGHNLITAVRTDTPAALVTPGLMNAGAGLMLVLAVIVGMVVMRGNELSHDLSQPYIYVLAAAALAFAVGGGMLMTKRARSRA